MHAIVVATCLIAGCGGRSDRAPAATRDAAIAALDGAPFLRWNGTTLVPTSP